MIQTIDAAAFQRMVIHAAAAISTQKQSINDLNVFPVPLNMKIYEIVYWGMFW